MKLILSMIVLAVVLIAGCTQLNSIICQPNWVLGLPSVTSMAGNRSGDVCKSQCYATDKVTSYKIESDDCYCDVNNCNPNAEQTAVASIQSKPEINCKNNDASCQNLMENCTDSILIMETTMGNPTQGYTPLEMSLDITNKVSYCSVLYHVDNSSNAELENTSMTCSIPMINGKIISSESSSNCTGSLIDKLGGPAQSGYSAPTARGFGQIQILSPWSIVANNGAIQLNLQNRVGGEITVNGASVTIGSRTYTYTASQTLASGATAAVSFITSTWSNSIAKTGDSYTATVSIQYTYSGQVFSSTGTLTGTYS